MLLLAMLAFAPAASAAETEPQLTASFGCEGPCGSFSSPQQAAVDEASGDVWVIDEGNSRVIHFGPAGEYLGQINSATIPGEPTFAPISDSDIAVDNSGGPNQGDVYVVTEGGGFCATDCAVYAFNAEGEYLWSKNLEEGANHDPCGVAVDRSGRLWTTDFEGGVQQRSVEPGHRGEPIGSAIVLPTHNSCHIAFDNSNNLYVNKWHTTVVKFFAPNYTTSEEFEHQVGTNDVDTDSSNGNLYSLLGAYVEIFAPAGTQLFRFPAEGNQALPGLAVNGATGLIYVVNRTSSKVEVWTREGGAAPKPTARTGEASPVGTETAMLSGKTNPDGAATTCAFEYGTTTALGSTAACGAAAGSGTSEVAVSAQASGLTDGTTYYYRLVTESANGKTIGAIRSFTTLKPSHMLTVVKSGSGSGTVGSAPAGIDCGSTCSAEFEEGTEVTLTATPGAHSEFSGWSGGGCSGAGTCTITIGAAATQVNAEFRLESKRLTVLTGGSGSGSVTCNGTTCASSYPYGAAVTLAASAASGSTFAGFSGGGCSSTPCEITLEADTAVTATFNAVPHEEGNPNAYGQCVAKAVKAYKKAKKAAAHKHGKAKGLAIKAANKRKRKAIAACKAQFK